MPPAAERTADAGYLTRRLVDVAQDPQALLRNMELMCIDPASIDMIVITHCHYDHTRGLAELLQCMGKENVPVVSHPDMFRLNFVTVPYLRHVGVLSRDSREKIEAAGGLLYLTRTPLQLLPGLFTTGEVPRTTAFEEVGIALMTLQEGEVVEDTMPDDLAIIARLKERGIFIITGCSHAGIVNISNHAQTLAGTKQIDGIIGGFHLIEASEERIEKTASALAAMKIDRLLAGHCTGFRAQVALRAAFNKRFEPMATGMRVVV